MALEALSQNGRARRRTGKLPDSAPGGQVNGRSQAPAGGLLGRLAGFGAVCAALSAHISFVEHWPGRARHPQSLCHKSAKDLRADFP
jgi:hypothetical protein